MSCAGNPVINVRPGNNPTAYAIKVSTLGQILVRQIGVQEPAGTTLYYGNPISGCWVKGPPTAQDRFFSTTDVLPADTFVEMTETLE